MYHLTGVRDDPPDIRGASFLFQNLMLLGTKNFDTYDQIFFIRRTGGYSDRSINYDFSFFYHVIPEDEFNNVLLMESERITSLKLDNRSITLEKNNIYSKNYRAISSNLLFKAIQTVYSKLFEGTVYETPLYGKLDSITSFDNQAVQKLYENYKDTSKILLVVTGKFDLFELRKSIIKHFGNIPSPPTELPKPTSNPRISRIETKYEPLYWEGENLDKPFAVFGIRAPGKESYDYLFFEFLRYYLLDERVSKLNEILNQNYGLDVIITHEYTNYISSNALFIKLFAKNRMNFDKARIYINNFLASLQKSQPGALSGSDFKNTHALMKIDFFKNMMSLEKLGIFIAERFYLNGKLNPLEEYLSRIDKISIYDIHRIAQKYLDKKRRVDLFVLPKSGAGK